MIAVISTVRYPDRARKSDQKIERWVGIAYRMRDWENLDYPLGGINWVERFQMPSRP